MPRRIRICYFNQWAADLEPVAGYLARVSGMDLSRMVARPGDAELMRTARLDCDWYAANARCFAAMQHPGIKFLPAWITGKQGILEVARAPREPGEERWLVTIAHQPQKFDELAGKVFAMLARSGVRHLFYAFDEASRFMPCFNEIASHLDVLIHDEAPLTDEARALLAPDCMTRHRSWVANFAPGETVFNDSPEEKIYFLGSQLGLSDHRKRQFEFLKRRFKDRFVASHDHTTPVDSRVALNRYMVGLAPEGRKFTTPAMSATHTDRPFWFGCLGMVPVSEDSKLGGRLESLHRAGLIVRYAHGDLESLANACERALAMTNAERHRIFAYFNAHETIGAVTTEALVAAGVRTEHAVAV